MWDVRYWKWSCQRRFMDVVKEDMEKVGVTVEEAGEAEVEAYDLLC